MEALQWVMARKGQMSLLEGDPGLCIVLYFCSFFFWKEKAWIDSSAIEGSTGFCKL